MKVVVNRCYGGFGLSDEAYEKYLNYKGIKYIKSSKKTFGESQYKVENGEYLSYYNIERNDPYLVKVVEELGEKANGAYARLEVVEIPDDIEWEIEEYDGNEWVAEKHRTW